MIVLIVVASLALALAIFAYGRALETRSAPQPRRPRVGEPRDMWMSSLLECWYEPNKQVFGPAKIIPADAKLVSRVARRRWAGHP